MATLITLYFCRKNWSHCYYIYLSVIIINTELLFWGINDIFEQNYSKT